MTTRIAFDDLTIGAKALLLGEQADVGQRAQRELAAIAAGRLEVTDAPEGVNLPGATSAKTTKRTKHVEDHTTTVVEPDDDQDDDDDDGDDDSEEDDEEESSSRGRKSGIEADVLEAARRLGLEGKALAAFMRQAMSDQASALPSSASASASINMTDAAPQRAAATQTPAAGDAPPPIVALSPWRERP